jgi:type III secretion protein W
MDPTNSNFVAGLTGANISASTKSFEKGVLMGQFSALAALENPDADSFINESAEELGFFVAEKMEKSLKELKPKKEKEATKSENKSLNEKELSVEEAAKLQLNLNDPEHPPERLLRLFERLKNLKDPDQEKIREEVAHDFEDVTDQHIALTFIEEHGDTDATKVLSKLATESKEGLMKESGPQVRAGLNVLQTALNASKEGLGEISQLRDFYRDVVLKHEGILSTYEAIKEEYGTGKLDQAATFLLQSVGNDMSAQGSSIEKSQLKSIIDNLYQVQVLINIYEKLNTLMDRLGENFNLLMTMNGEQLMESLLNFTQNTLIDAQQIIFLAQNIGLSRTAARIYFLTAFFEQTRLIPIKIYPSLEQRSKLLDSEQKALDLTITEEESEESDPEDVNEGSENEEDDENHTSKDLFA